MHAEIAALIAAVPREGASHHAFVERTPGESLDNLVQRAFAECGDARCRIMQVWQSGDCMALVRGRKFVYWTFPGDNMVQAKERAMNSCNNSSESCELLKNECFK
jgi:hypothetical protein